MCASASACVAIVCPRAYANTLEAASFNSASHTSGNYLGEHPLHLGRIESACIFPCPLEWMEGRVEIPVDLVDVIYSGAGVILLVSRNCFDLHVGGWWGEGAMPSANVLRAILKVLLVMFSLFVGPLKSASQIMATHVTPLGGDGFQGPDP